MHQRKNIEKKASWKKMRKSAEFFRTKRRNFGRANNKFQGPQKTNYKFPWWMQELPFCAMDVATPPVTGSLTVDGQLDLDAGCHYRLSLGHHFGREWYVFFVFDVLRYYWYQSLCEPEPGLNRKTGAPYGCQRCIGWLEVRYQNLSYRGVKTKMPLNASKDSKTR